MGRAPLDERTGGPFWHAPPEDLCDGCPGAWYRTAFAESLHIYLPTQTGETWMESPMLTREAPRLVIEAVQYFKAQRSQSVARGWDLVSG